MINLVFGIEGDDLGPVMQELEFLDYDSRSILVPHQLSERVLLDFLQLLLHSNSRIKDEDARISVTRNSETRLFYIREIRYVEAQRNLVSIAAEQEVFSVYASLNKIEHAISSFGFIQIHGSFLVAVSHIKAYTARYVVMDDGKQINIGRGFKKEFRKLMHSMNIIALGT